ncbi:alpha/beta hydrolase family protein [Intrasporangium sp.]|uniref:alpha/beta fold hydrolase n=1 Tax=Intrasporangium sp. TaxID=1925024 RepID=UPI002939C5BE|nr:alpha/beta hydrolase family protein [Intrasporangium sp.]MDV3220253.1 alpha/beta fold hydrolase [Intrasporangium sp.]
MTTFVLVPGAGGAGWYWHRVVPLLVEAGHQALALDLPAEDPSRGLPEYAELVGAAVDSAPDVVLVAQSLGGFTAAQVAATGAHPTLRELVFVNAMIPQPGERAGDWGEHVDQEAAMRIAAEEGGWPVDVDLHVHFLHDVAPEVFESGAEHMKDEADAVFEAPCDLRQWPPPVPVRVVAGRDDRLFPVAFQQCVARQRLGVEPDVLPGGHLMALSRPAELADYLAAV